MKQKEGQKIKKITHGFKLFTDESKGAACLHEPEQSLYRYIDADFLQVKWTHLHVQH